ncbi:YchJ family protein [Synechococcus sp. A10-1-5-9]|uniref:YchJ family protein n=1 Tax=Synechococcus sp. A10-1-5-9 TaxID=3392295 RepID=UPI0039EC3633
MARGFADATADRAACPCGSGAKLGSCCGPFHQGLMKAQTAEQLMRSRYSAYALGEIEYLIASHPEPDISIQKRRRELRINSRQIRWIELEILAVECGGIEDCQGTVQFAAHFIAAGQRRCLQETSLFQRRDGQLSGDWLYIRAL